MIYLWTATPGTGKTCYVVKQLIDNWMNDEKNEDRRIYSNIEGLKIEGILKSPDDFRECEDGSIIIYDEAQDIKHYSSEVRDDPVARALSKHRHRGFDIHFITQDPALLNKWVLKNVFLHYYFWRPAQRATVEIYTFARAIVSPTKQDFKNAFDKKIWRFEKHYLQYYKSTVVNTSQKHGSQKRTSIIITAVILFAVLLYFIKPLFTLTKSPVEQEQSQQGQPVSEQASEQETEQFGAVQHSEQTSTQLTDDEKHQSEQNRRIYTLYQERLPKDYDIIRQNPDLQVRGVVVMGGKCQAYNAYGDLMIFSEQDCKGYMQNSKVYKSVVNTVANSVHE